MVDVYKWTVEDINALKKAIASGILIVQYEDKRVEYKSTAQMLSALSRMETEYVSGSSNTKITRQVRLSSNKGF